VTYKVRARSCGGSRRQNDSEKGVNQIRISPETQVNVSFPPSRTLGPRKGRKCGVGKPGSKAEMPSRRKHAKERDKRY